MPSYPFYGVAAGNPVNLQRRIAVQADPAIPPDEADWVDYLSNGGKLGISPQWIEAQLIRGSTVRDTPIEGKMASVVEPQSMGDLDPGSVAQILMLANVAGKVTHTNPSGTHHRYQLGAFQADPVPATFALLSDDDTGLIWRFLGGRASGFSIAAQSRQNLSLTVPIVVGPADCWGVPDQSVGTGSDLPHIIGTFFPADLAGQLAPDATDADLIVKIIDDLPTLQVKAKVTAAALFSGATQNLSYGEFNYLKALYGAVNDYVLGKRSDQVRIYWPSGATLVADDEFTIPKRRERWTPSYGVRRPVAEVQARFYVNGIAIPMDGGYTVTVNLPGVEALEAPGFAQSIGTVRQGFADVQITVNRRLRDLLFQNPLLSRSQVACVIEPVTDTLIGATSVPFGITIIAPNCYPTGETVSVGTGETTKEEQYVLLCKRAGSDYTYNGMTVDAEEEYGIVIDTDQVIEALGA